VFLYRTVKVIVRLLGIDSLIRPLLLFVLYKIPVELNWLASLAIINSSRNLSYEDISLIPRSCTYRVLSYHQLTYRERIHNQPRRI
jgi:hypothetical protein